MSKYSHSFTEDDLRFSSKKKQRKETVKTHTIHEYQDKETRYQLTHHLRPWAKRSILGR